MHITILYKKNMHLRDWMFYHSMLDAIDCLCASSLSYTNGEQCPKVGVPASLTVVPSRLKLVPPVMRMVDMPQKWVYLLA